LVDAIAISSFAETVIPVDENGPVHFGIMWYENCTRPQFERVMRHGSARRIREVTKLDVSWMYSSSKILKFKDDFPDLYRGTRAFLDISSFAAYMLTGNTYFDLSLSSRTQLLDLARGEWSAEMAELWEVDAEKLPPLRASAAPRGTLKSALASELGMRPSTIVTVAGHDHTAAALGSGVSRYEQGMISVGTSAGFYSPMPPESFDTEEFLSHGTMSGRYSPYPDGMYAMTGIDAGGLCVDWFIHKVLSADYGILERFGRGGHGFLKTGALFLPNLRPHTAKLPPGGFTEVTDKDTGVTLLQAIMEAITFECKYMFGEIFKSKRMDGGMKEVVMTGGGARNEPFVRILANTLGSTISVHHMPHSAGLLGGAMVAAIASGRFGNPGEAAGMLGHGTDYHPHDLDLARYLDEKYGRHMAAFRNRRNLHD
jgi:xylulokinase